MHTRLANLNDPAVVLLPSAYDFEALKTLAPIKTLIGLHAYRVCGADFAFPNLSVRQFAKTVQLSERPVYEALRDLAARKLIVYIPRQNAAAFVGLCDPTGSGNLIDKMLFDDVDERDAAYAEHDESYWYRELAGIDIQLDPKAYEWHARPKFTFSANCPFCGHIEAKRRQFRFKVTVRSFVDGHHADWLCHKCSKHGDCRRLFDLLWVRRKLQEDREAALPKTQFPMKEETTHPDDACPYLMEN